ncbi:MAG TPA: hemerythrin domain-containing protein, partial [Vicinamibacteria bacterium]|nr:hemerythrin domain-containing protein [Vicinamibacteria bacterium]
MDAISLLTKDHETVSKLFREHERADEAKKAGLFERIRGELEVHAQIEERIFYPALRRAQGPALAVQVGEAVREHQDVKSLLRSLTGLQAGNLDYDAKFRQIVQNVEHHVQEEEGEMFPQARTLLGEDRLRTLGAEMMALKQTLSVGGAVPRALQAVGAVGG